LHLLAEDWLIRDSTTADASSSSTSSSSGHFPYLNPLDKDPQMLSAYVSGLISVSNRDLHDKNCDIDQESSKQISQVCDSSDSVVVVASGGGNTQKKNRNLSFLWVIALHHLLGGGQESGSEVSWGEKKRFIELMTAVSFSLSLGYTCMFFSFI
jgi:hypothetical protein